MGATPELRWVGRMRKHVGLTEIKGFKHNPIILDYIDKAFKATGQKTWIKDDETAWCGSFLGGVFAEAELAKHIPKEFFRALSWAQVGAKLTKPCYGCVVVFKRTGGGHVGIVVGKTKTGRLKVLGANQSDQVNIQDFPTDEVVAYRWCGDTATPSQHRFELPILAAGTIRSSLT